VPFNKDTCYDSLSSAITTDASGAIFATGMVSDWTDDTTTYSGNNVGLLRMVP
jgi:hypothetical protein